MHKQLPMDGRSPASKRSLEVTSTSRVVTVLALAALVAGCQGGGNGEPPQPAGQAVTVASPAARAGDPRGQVFIDKGCVQCHKVTKLGVPGGEIGPDLSVAATDVKSRFGTDVESFLKNPTGTMQIVLSQQIKLTEEEREDIAEILIDLEKGEKDGKHEKDEKREKDGK
jgi:mono/diheme cytochrome c family protein